MIKRKVTIQNPAGLQVNEAGRFCDLAMEFDCSIHFVYRDGSEANAKSVLSVLGAAIRYNETIELVCDGPGEEEAADALTELLSGQ